VHNALKSFAEKKKLQFTYSIAESVPGILAGDPVRLKQLLLNLANNALKFTEKGSVEINIRAEKKENEMIDLHVNVKDTGIGIPGNKLHTIFDTFSQADSSTTRKYGGTGLGLAISKKLVELQGGTIGVKSVAGKGSEFYFTIPYKKGTLPGNEKNASGALDLSRLADKKILVVDDDEMNKTLVRMILDGWGVKTSLAGSGIEAIEQIEKENFDAVLMDIQMPGLSGIETIKLIRSTMKGEKATVPVIAVTGNALKGEEEKCIRAGMNDYISKPFKEEDLYSKLLKHFSN
jgi:CheY-like chemotaxis protein